MHANVGNPVNVTNGNMYVQQTDYSLPGHAKTPNTLLDLQYQFNAVNNVTQMIDSAGTHSYSYDSLDRLTGADLPPKTGPESDMILARFEEEEEWRKENTVKRRSSPP